MFDFASVQGYISVWQIQLCTILISTGSPAHWHTHTHAHTNTNKREREEEKKERKTKLLYWQREKQGANMFVFCLAQFRTWIQHFQPLFFPSSSSSSSSRGIQQLLPTGTERERERDRQTDRQTQTKTIWRNTQLQSGLDLCIPKVGRSFLDLSAESNEKKEKKKRKKKKRLSSAADWIYLTKKKQLTYLLRKR